MLIIPIQTTEKIILVIDEKICTNKKIAKKINTTSTNISVLVNKLIKQSIIKRTRSKELSSKHGQKNKIKSITGPGADFLELTQRGQTLKEKIIDLRNFIDNAK